VRWNSPFFGPALWAMRSKRNFLTFYTTLILVLSAFLILPKFAPSFPPTPKAGFGFLLMIVWSTLCGFGGAILLWYAWGKQHQLPKPPNSQ
jgi:hypothetical protein